ncbi:efflux RND transporter permease subunit [Engelhardtia mirabilis]|uniref:Efflux pump membrane transporter BepG n=1 Tax=Engelhardtia mirabilis TaxID=2528011 RepID=A0A518BDZ3_9BACT|nr:Efflux pump membrane transporter BepG [Planctomycetes bacterium Pla133]QDU99531.1 Efflux pump membrane transporter BepG [Planctomycetes bacterium Pla86]
MSDRAPAEHASLTSRIVESFLGSNFSILLILLCLGMGAVALTATPREEDPQIVVPFIDVAIEAPGASAQETKTLAAEPLERLLLEISGVEHVYSMSAPGQALVTVRFEVGEDREKALVNVYNKIQSNQDRVPTQVSSWIVRPVELDDVPILTLTLFGEGAGTPDLVRYADELAARLQTVADVSRVAVVGGHRRTVRVQLDAPRLAARGITASHVMDALGADNVNARVGALVGPEGSREVEVGPFLSSAAELESVVVAMADGRAVLLGDVARVVDGPAEPTTYTRLAFGPSAAALEHGAGVPPAWVDGNPRPAVTLSVAKRKGTNAVVVAEQTLARFDELAGELLPDDVHWLVTRNYGETADEKVNELVGHLLIAVGTIVVLVGASLGWRAALIVALAVPLTLAVTLFADLLVGYSINRVTLFALILSLGLLVDDPIVDVENIHRHLSLGKLPPRQATVFAVDEVRPPVILATLAVIVSFLPLFFVTGMMGPYMRPMPFNVPVAMLLSLVVAFTVTPWATYHLLKNHVRPGDGHEVSEGVVIRSYRRLASFFLTSRRRSLVLLGVVGLSFLGSIGLAALGFVPLKMLPFDNKSEFQVIVDAPEGTGLETMDRAVTDLMRDCLAIGEVTDVTGYTGHASPHDFNGMVRHYFLRRGPQVADLRVNLVPRHNRGRQAHEIVLAARPALEATAAQHGVRISIVEAPPGPPVLAGVVAEVYGPLDGSADELASVTADVAERFGRVPFLHDVDTFVEASRPRLSFQVDRLEAAARGVAPQEVARTLAVALSGTSAGVLRAAGERLPLEIRLELPRAERSTEADLLALTVPSASGAPVPLGELVRRVEGPDDRALYRKDLRDMQYVVGEAVGKSPVDAIFALMADLRERPLPEGYEVDLAGEGEWQVTVDVFRDLGLAFAAALAGIYVLLVAQTRSFGLSALMMLAIPLTMIGVFPGFWILNLIAGDPVGPFENPIFFTATGMIGVIALAGIVVRNSIILIDFIETHRALGLSTVDACIEAGAVRLRPIVLTAGAAVMGAWVIVFDPIFSGLAWSFVFGIVASTAFTLLVIPIAYALTQGASARRSAA